MIVCKYIDQNYTQIDNVIFLTKYRGNASENTTCTCRCSRKNIWLGLDSTTGWRMFSPVIDQDHKRNSFQINIIHGIEGKADLIFYAIHYTVHHLHHILFTQHKPQTPKPRFFTLYFDVIELKGMFECISDRHSELDYVFETLNKHET